MKSILEKIFKRKHAEEPKIIKIEDDTIQTGEGVDEPITVEDGALEIVADNITEPQEIIEEGYKAVVLKGTYYSVEGINAKQGDVITIMSEDRLKYLEDQKYVRRV